MDHVLRFGGAYTIPVADRCQQLRYLKKSPNHLGIQFQIDLFQVLLFITQSNQLIKHKLPQRQKIIFFYLYRFPKQIRNLHPDQSCSPSIGTYKLNSSNLPKSAAYTMQGKYKFFQPTSSGVGPQAYSPNITSKQPSYSFSYKNDIIFEKNNNPGVAQYNLDQTVQELRLQESSISNTKSKRKVMKGCSFAQSKRPQSSEVTPGPSSYNTTLFVHQQKGQYAYSMTRSQRVVQKDKEELQTPDPRTYYPKKPHTRWPAWRLGARSSTPSQEFNTPGPGAYYQEFKFSRTTSIGNSKRQSFCESHKPGPGSYDLQQSFFLKQSFRKKDGYDFRKKSKGIINKFDNFPGPQDYKINDSFAGKGIKYSIRSKHDKMFQQEQFIPGPGQYLIDSKKNSNQINFNDTMTKSQRVDLSFCNRTGPTVGPGSYILEDNFTKISKSRQPIQPFKIRKAMQSPEKPQNLPGPGSYDLNCNLGFLPVYMEKGMSKKLQIKYEELKNKIISS